MQVRKRNGVFENVNLGKIEISLKRYCGDLPNIDVYRIASKTVGGLVDGVTTLELDMLSVRTAKDLIIDDPIYAKVAARILANVIQKEVAGLDIQSFSQSIEIGYQQGLISETTHALVMTNKRKLNAAIKHERDWNMEYHGLQTVYDRYLLKHPTTLRPSGGGERLRAVIETPQYFFLRVACGLANDASEAIELYTLLSSLEYMCSTPTLFNSGTKHSQMSSCYLLSSPIDSLDAIYKAYSDVALLSKFAGGIGISLSGIRGKDALIRGTNGKSNGIVPWAHTLSASVGSTNQGGRRKGAAAIYLEPHHPDIMQFLELKDNSGEREQRAYNLNLANWIPDLFMKRVKADEMWSLFDATVAPDLVDLYGDAYEKRFLELETDRKYTEQLPARKVYARMMRTLAETGNGWVNFKDTCNRRGNQVNDEAGTMIHLSNLCVAPETTLLTDVGHLPISSLEDKQMKIWNGREFSTAIIRKTGKNQRLIRVALNNGATLDCTPYHKFYVYRDARKFSNVVVERRAQDLQIGDRLLRSAFPIIDQPNAIDFPHAYTHGFFCGDGTYTNSSATGRPFVALEKKELVPHLTLRSGSGVEDAIGRLNYLLPLDLSQKFIVPSAEYSLISRLDWLAGLFDADGTVARNGTNESIQVASIDIAFLETIRLMLQTLGIDGKVTKLRNAGSVQVRSCEKMYLTQEVFRLLINSNDTQALLALGLRCKRLSIQKRTPQRKASKFTRVLAVVDNGRIDDTYCLSEPIRHMAVFNGILTGQCTEILEVTSSGRKTSISRDEMNKITTQDMVDQSINIVGFDYKSDNFEAITGSEVAVCLSAGTPILTRNGYRAIEDCNGEDVYVPFKSDHEMISDPKFITAQLIDNGQKMVYQIGLSDGRTIQATPDHKFLVRVSRKYTNVTGQATNVYLWKMLSQLTEGDKIIRPHTPITSEVKYDKEFGALGWFVGDGWCLPSGTVGVCFAPEKFYAKVEVMPVVESWHQSVPVAVNARQKHLPCGYTQPNGVFNWQSTKQSFFLYLQDRFGVVPNKSVAKTVPEQVLKGSLSQKASFLSGLFSSDGSIIRKKGKPNGLALAASSRVMLEQVQQLLAEFGIVVHLTWFYVTDRDRWQGSLRTEDINSVNNFLTYIGFRLHPLKQNDLNSIVSESQKKFSRDYVEVRSISPIGIKQVYDLHVPEAHHFVANGLVTHNCNLGSINLARGYIKHGKLDKDKLRKNVAIAIKYLDRVINRNFYPISEAESSNMRWRPIGLGLMGLADFFMQLRIPYDSDQAIKLSGEIQEEIYYQALKTSCELAKELGPHRDFHLTRAAKGELQFDLAGVTPSDPERWDALKAEIKEHGVRNSLTIAIAPTACQAGTNVIQTQHGPKSLYQILEENAVPYADIEASNEPMWIDLKPFYVPTMNGLKKCDKIWFNGAQPTFKVEFVGNVTYEFTGNHRLYINLHDSLRWCEVRTLSAGYDNIVTSGQDVDQHFTQITSIERMEMKPTWDIEVEDEHHYLMSNGVVSHNTISHICGVEECIEPIKSNLLKRETLSGEFVSVNKYLVEDLRKLGKWNADIVNQLKVSEGSIAHIAGLPAELYAIYKTVWEMSMKSLISHAVARGAYIDQSHSLNMFIDLNKYDKDKRIGVLSSLYMHAWESGVKTTYYFRSRAATRIEQTTTERSDVKSVMAPETVETCESCT